MKNTETLFCRLSDPIQKKLRQCLVQHPYYRDIDLDKRAFTPCSTFEEISVNSDASVRGWKRRLEKLVVPPVEELKTALQQRVLTPGQAQAIRRYSKQLNQLTCEVNCEINEINALANSPHSNSSELATSLQPRCNALCDKLAEISSEALPPEKQQQFFATERMLKRFRKVIANGGTVKKNLKPIAFSAKLLVDSPAARAQIKANLNLLDLLTYNTDKLLTKICTAGEGDFDELMATHGGLWATQLQRESELLLEQLQTIDPRRFPHPKRQQYLLTRERLEAFCTQPVLYCAAASVKQLILSFEKGWKEGNYTLLAAAMELAKLEKLPLTAMLKLRVMGWRQKISGDQMGAA